MLPLSLLKLEPDAKLVFAERGGCVRLTLTNVSSCAVAFKVKATAPKSYTIKPSNGSVQAGAAVEVQILKRSAPEGEDAASQEKKRPDRFLVQAASVDDVEALGDPDAKGKASGLSKFWESVPKEAVEQRQLEVVVVADQSFTGDGAAPPKTHANQGGGKGGGSWGGGGSLPRPEEIDAIIGKISKPGRCPPPATVRPGGNAAPSLGAPGLDASGGDSAGNSPSLKPSPAPFDDVAASGGGGRAAAPQAQQAPPRKAAARRKEDLVLQKHSRPVTSVATDPNGTVLFTCGKDKLIYSWSLPNGDFLDCYDGHRGAVWACSVSPDGLLLLSCGADNAVILWQISPAAKVAELQLPGVARCVEWSPFDATTLGLGRSFLACNNSFAKKPAALAVFLFEDQKKPAGAVKELNSAVAALAGATPRRLLCVEEPTLPSAPVQVAWAGEACQYVCSVHSSGEVLFWSGATGGLAGRLRAHEGVVSQVAFPRNRWLMATCGREDMSVRLWDLRLGVAQGEIQLLQTYTGDRPLNAVAVRPALTPMEVGAAAAGVRKRATCDCLAGGGQDARDVALVGAGTDDQFEPVPLSCGVRGEMEEFMDEDCSDDLKGKKSGGHFGPIHTLLSWPPEGDGGRSLSISGSEDGNVRMRELREPPAGTQRPRAKEKGPCEEGLRCVALYDFDPAAAGWPPTSKHKALPLQRGQELCVLKDDAGDGWASGCLPGKPKETGYLPANYILPLSRYFELMEEVNARLRKDALAAKADVAAALGSTDPNASQTEEDDGDCAQS